MNTTIEPVMYSDLSRHISLPDHALIVSIAERFEAFCDDNGAEHEDRLSLIRNITATHANVCALDLPGLLAASDRDLAHDVGGIGKHLNRETFVFDTIFNPIYSQHSITAWLQERLRKGAIDRAEKNNCQRCNEALDNTKAVWLELNSTTGRYAVPGGVPLAHSQGCFPFGAACAGSVRRAKGKLTRRGG